MPRALLSRGQKNLLPKRYSIPTIAFSDSHHGVTRHPAQHCAPQSVRGLRPPGETRQRLSEKWRIWCPCPRCSDKCRTIPARPLFTRMFECMVQTWLRLLSLSPERAHHNPAKFSATWANVTAPSRKQGMWCGSPKTEKEGKEKPTVTATETVGKARTNQGFRP